MSIAEIIVQVLSVDYCCKNKLIKRACQLEWYYDTGVDSVTGLKDCCLLPAVIMQRRRAMIFKYYDMSSDKTDILVKAFIDYLSGLVFKLDVMDMNKNLSAVSDALARIDYIVLTENIPNKEFVTDIIESNLKWLDNLNLKHLLCANIEKICREQQMKLIGEM